MKKVTKKKVVKKKVKKAVKKKAPKLTHLILDTNNGEKTIVTNNTISEELKNYYFNFFNPEDINYMNKEIKVFKLVPVKFKIEASLVNVTLEE